MSNNISKGDLRSLIEEVVSELKIYIDEKLTELKKEILEQNKIDKTKTK